MFALVSKQKNTKKAKDHARVIYFEYKLKKRQYLNMFLILRVIFYKKNASLCNRWSSRRFEIYCNTGYYYIILFIGQALCVTLMFSYFKF